MSTRRPLQSNPACNAFSLPGAGLSGLGALATALLLAGAFGSPAPVAAQSESFLLQRGSQVGPATRVKPMNCVTAPDGSVTCDTTLENPPGDTRARPEFSPFGN